MKRRWVGLAGLALGLSTFSLTGAPAHATTSYSVGDTGPGGGIVFITPSTPGNSTGQYFEARLSGISLRACTDPLQFLADVDDDAIGAGAASTEAIRLECARDVDNTSTNSAFLWVGAQTIGNFADWFIPNSGEALRVEAERSNAAVGALVAGLSVSTWISKVKNSGSNPGSPDAFLYNKTLGQTNSWTSLNGQIVNFLIARTFSTSGGGTSPDSSPSPVLQQIGLTDGSPCESDVPKELNWAGVSGGGWGESWAQWMNGGLGGPVCTRVLVYSNALNRWTVAS